MNKTTQVLVIGGGPGGSTAATLLARQGFTVTLLEREHFPRYHIGESLLPSCLEILDLVGAREKIEAHGFQQKDGGYFEWGSDSWTLDFRKLHHPYGFEVVRSEFDQLLLEHAKSQGVQVFEGVEVQSLAFEGERPRSARWAQADSQGGEETGEISFDVLVDASGRAGIMATRYLQSRYYPDTFQNVAIWGYWQGAKRLEDQPQGAIAVGSIKDGWLWGIPLHTGRMSVGLVMHKTTFKDRRQQVSSLEHLLRQAIDECPLLCRLLESGELVTEVRAEQDFSYMTERLAGPGYFLVGDAACFVDPLLSTGVHLATSSALLAAASIGSFLRREATEEQARAFYSASYRQAYLRIIVLVSGLYQQYNGEASYFWQAQQLTNQDYVASPGLNEAFLQVVSGMEDLKDVTQSARQLELPSIVPEEEQARAEFMQGVYTSLFKRFSPTEAATDGWYLYTKPHLGLARVAAD